MTGRHAGPLLAGAGVVLLASLSAPAVADTPPAAHLSVVSQSDTSATLLLSVSGLPAGTGLAPGDVTVLVDGARAHATATTTEHGTAQATRRRAVLVFDTSGSMAGAAISGARAAALAFLAAAPGDVEIGLVGFADRPRLLVAPTSSRAKVRSAVAGLVARGETSLYDGVLLGQRVLGSSGERTLVVLSDGADTRSRTSLGAITESLHRSGVRMDAVALNTGDAVRRTLARMASASGGRVTAAADASQLAAVFSSAAQSLATQLVLDVVLPRSERTDTATVEVRVATSAGDHRDELRATTTIALPGRAATQHRSGPALDKHHQIPVVPLLLLFAGLAGLAYSLLQTLDARRAPDTRTRKLLARYTLTGAAPASQDDEHDAGIGRSGPMRKALALAERLVDKPGRRDKLMLRLGRANVSLQPNEWLVVQCAATVIGAVLGTLLFGTLGAGLVVGFVAYLGTNAWLALKGRRRLRAFDEHLPNSLQLVAGSLSAGFSLAQALDGVVREGLEPISGELHRALAEARLGVPLEDALDGIARRMDSVDFRWVVMAIRIQREVGGNLAEVLLNTSMMMRERARLRRQVKALSAEGRLSAYVLFAIPLLMTLYLTSFRRAYIRTLYTDPIGIGFMVTAIVLLCIGAVWMRKIVTVEV